MSSVREHFLELDRTIDIDVELIGQSEHVAGRTELGQVTAGDGEFSPSLQTLGVHQLELDFAGERGDGIQTGRVQRNAEHVLLVLLRQ